METTVSFRFGGAPFFLGGNGESNGKEDGKCGNWGSAHLSGSEARGVLMPLNPKQQPGLEIV